MYIKYSTDALVLGSWEHGEADRVFMLYTKDFGLVYARATSVREERSRLRYALSHYAHANVSLICGKRGWKLVGASSVRALLGEYVNIFARIARLMTRLVAGEEKNEYLFSTLSSAHAQFFAPHTRVATIELICVARVLFALGYLSSEALRTALFTHTAYELPHLTEAEHLRESLVISVNQAIIGSH